MKNIFIKLHDTDIDTDVRINVDSIVSYFSCRFDVNAVKSGAYTRIYLWYPYKRSINVKEGPVQIDSMLDGKINIIKLQEVAFKDYVRINVNKISDYGTTPWNSHAETRVRTINDDVYWVRERPAQIDTIIDKLG